MNFMSGYDNLLESVHYLVAETSGKRRKTNWYGG